LAALVAVGCSSQSPPPTSASGSPRALLPATPTELPSFGLDQFDGLLASLHGRPVVVNVWASWCGPCRAEGPVLAHLSRQYAGRVQFLGVDIQDTRTAARAFVQTYGWIYPSVFDQSGAIRDGLGFVGQPVTAVFDRAGNRLHVFPGAVDPGELTQQIERALQT
jgi:cytochrome c biogenesis protein CcmG/thiol:disulfide interchange protein DsbE